MSSKLSVGVHLLTVLALYRDQPLTSPQLACSVNTNPVVVRRLLGMLREAGFVESKKGSSGGWFLTADPTEVTLLDVLRVVEPECEAFALHRNEPDHECLVGRNIQNVLTTIYADVMDGMSRQLDRTTIASVAESVEKIQSEASTAI